jgi:hypothetical protein
MEFSGMTGPYETMISTIRVSEPGRLTDTMDIHTSR